VGLVQTTLNGRDRLANQPRDEPNKGGRIDGLTLNKHQRDQECLINRTITDVQCNDDFLLHIIVAHLIHPEVYSLWLVSALIPREQ